MYLVILFLHMTETIACQFFRSFLSLNDIVYSAYSIIRGVRSFTRFQWVSGSLFAGMARLT